MVDACHYIHLLKPIECTKPRVNCDANCGLRVIMMNRYRFIDCNKCTPLAGVLIVEEAMEM